MTRTTRTRRELWAGLLAGAVLAAGSAAGAQTSAPNDKDDLFAGTEKFSQGASSVTQIDMDPSTLGKVEGKDGLQAHRTVLSVVHTYTYDKPGMYRIEDVEAFRKKLDTGEWHCSVHIREMKTGQSTDVCNRNRDDGLKESAVITVQPMSLTFIHTIRKPGPGEGSSQLSSPMGLNLQMPAMHAETAIAQAHMQINMAQLGPQIQAQMARIQPQIQAEMAAIQPQIQAQMETMRNFRGPDPEQMRKLQDDLKNLGRQRNVAPKQTP